MSLRLAGRDDYQHIIRMARRFHEASPYSDLEFSEEQSRAVFEKYLGSNKTEIVIILAENDEPSPLGAFDTSSVYGMIIGACSSLPFSEDKVASELAWWVDEDKRGSKDSLMLFKAYQDWARRVGSKITQMAMLDDVTNLNKFYLKQGFVPAERSYIKRT